MKNRRLIAALFVGSLLLISAGILRAQQQEEEPAPGAARVSYIQGDVAVKRGDSGDLVPTTLNAPVVRGDSVSTGKKSRTEIQLDYATALRLDQNSQAFIADLTRSRIQIQVASGLVNLTVFKGAEAQVEVDTPNMAVHPLSEGSYHIMVISPTETEAVVRMGQAEISTPQGTTNVEKDQVIHVRGSDNPEFQIAKAENKGEWDEWNQERDKDIEEAASYNYTNRYYTGAQDLDRNGQWINTPDYGYVWSPNVTEPDWAPYRDGSWEWEPYWGWTWVSYEPWGWAPYHYGRWFWWGNSWVWWPGRVGFGFYPTWGPAWVNFLGFGFGGRNWGFGFGFGFGNIGWCPLGPYEGFHPWWGRGNTFNVVNVTNITNITNVTNAHQVRLGNPVINRFGRGGAISNLQVALNNPRVLRGISTVSAQNFGRGSVLHNLRPLDASTLRQGQVVNGTLPVVPTRESLRPVDRPVNRASFPNQAGNSPHFFSRNPVSVPRESFTQRAQAIQQMVQTHSPSIVARPTMNAGTANANTGRPAATAQPSTQAGWRRFGSTGTPGIPNRAPSYAPPRPVAPAAGTSERPGQGGFTRPTQPAPAPQAAPQSGWQRFSTAPRGENPGNNAPRATPASPGWERLAPRSPAPSNEGWSRPAPSGYGRPSLDIRKPIVTERPAPRSYSSGGYGGGSAPSGGNRGWSAPSGSNRSWSAPSGGSHGSSAPSGGGSRGWSGSSGGHSSSGSSGSHSSGGSGHRH